VKKYHPDINPTKEAEDEIRKITEAYEILSNVEKRKSYDDELKRNNRIHFEEQPNSTQSNPYTSYSEERDESDFEDWIKIYLKSYVPWTIRRMLTNIESLKKKT